MEAPAAVISATNKRFALVAWAAFSVLASAVPLALLSPTLANAWLPIFVGSVCLGALWGLKRAGLPQAVFSPIAWFLLASVMYYGVGPLIYIYGNDASIVQANDYYYVGTVELWRTNVLNALSIALTLFFFALGVSIPILRPFRRTPSYRTLQRAANCFSAVGIGFTLVTHGLRSLHGQDFIMPGIFYNLAQCGLGGLFLYAFLYFRRVPGTKIAFLAMAAFVGFFALTSLMKEEILEFAMVLFLGFFAARPSTKKLLVTIVLVALGLPSLQLGVTTLRILTWTEESTQSSAREIGAAVLGDGGEIASIKDRMGGDQNLWRRFAYAPAQAFAMDAYDAGEGGDTLRLALWAFVPRLIYPGKPIITQGDAFTKLVKGTEQGGGTAAGFFAEAYWNRGWLGVLVFSACFGLLLATLTQFSTSMVATRNYQFFPSAFIALHMGYRIDDWLVSATFNSIPVMILLGLMSAAFSACWVTGGGRQAA